MIDIHGIINDLNILELVSEPENWTEDILGGYDAISFPVNNRGGRLSRKYDIYTEFDESVNMFQRVQPFDRLEEVLSSLPSLSTVPTCILPFTTVQASPCKCRGIILTTEKRKELESLSNSQFILLDAETHYCAYKGALAQYQI